MAPCTNDASSNTGNSPQIKLRANAKAFSFSPSSSPSTSPATSPRRSANPYASYNNPSSQSYNPYMQMHLSGGYTSSGYSSSEGGYNSDAESTDSTITIVPTQRNEADGYNRFKNPSGKTATTASGQQIELFSGTHTGACIDACGSAVMLH